MGRECTTRLKSLQCSHLSRPNLRCVVLSAHLLACGRPVPCVPSAYYAAFVGKGGHFPGARCESPKIPATECKTHTRRSSRTSLQGQIALRTDRVGAAIDQELRGIRDLLCCGLSCVRQTREKSTTAFCLPNAMGAGQSMAMKVCSTYSVPRGRGRAKPHK